MAGPPLIQPKAGAVKAPELSLYYSIYVVLYKLEHQCLFTRVCTLHTLAALHIYTCWRLNVPLLGFAIFIVSYPLHKSKQDCVVASVSLTPITAGEGGVRILSHREGEEVQRSLYRLRRRRQSTAGCAFLFHPAPVREGHRPLLPRCRT